MGKETPETLRVRCSKLTCDRFQMEFDRLKRGRGYHTREDFLRELLDYAAKLHGNERGFAVVG
jgi:hypothetical protein